ncbi:MAG: metallophosphoesterase [Planctomycetota bacterium]
MCKPLPLLVFAVSLALLGGPACRADEPAERGPYLQDLRTDRITVLWTTKDPCMGRVRWGEAGAEPQELAEPLPARRHRIVIEGLAPGKEYSYRIVSGEEEGDLHAFRAAVEPGTPFTFVVYGDTRSNGKVHRRIAEAIRKERPLFLLHTGDLVSNGSKTAVWDDFFDEGRDLLAESPIYPALGNHEHDADDYFEAFELPGTERWYSFDVGDAHFLALDSNMSYLTSGRQRDFLRRDLEDHATSPWSFAYFHHPPYCTSENGIRDLEAMLLRATLLPPLEKLHVTAVFNGHNHNYQHSLVKGIHYVTTAGGGAGLYDMGDAESWTVTRAKAHHYTRVSVAPDLVTVTAIDLDGKTIEEFTIEPEQ